MFGEQKRVVRKKQQRKPKKSDAEAKRDTIERMHKYAIKVDEPKEITMLKIAAINSHDLSTGNQLKVHAPKCTYIFSIK